MFLTNIDLKLLNLSRRALMTFTLVEWLCLPSSFDRSERAYSVILKPICKNFILVTLFIASWISSLKMASSQMILKSVSKFLAKCLVSLDSSLTKRHVPEWSLGKRYVCDLTNILACYKCFLLFTSSMCIRVSCSFD